LSAAGVDGSGDDGEFVATLGWLVLLARSDAAKDAGTLLAWHRRFVSSLARACLPPESKRAISCAGQKAINQKLLIISLLFISLL
jgi:hypothetical protein